MYQPVFAVYITLGVMITQRTLRLGLAIGLLEPTLAHASGGELAAITVVLGFSAIGVLLGFVAGLSAWRAGRAFAFSLASLVAVFVLLAFNRALLQTAFAKLFEVAIFAALVGCIPLAVTFGAGRWLGLRARRAFAPASRNDA